MAPCSVCARFARFMETDEPPRPARVQPEAAGVHAPSCRHAEEPAFTRGRHGDDVVEIDMAAAYSPFPAPALPTSISLPASPTRFDIGRAGVEQLQRYAIADASSRMPPLPPAAMSQPDRVVFRSQPMPPHANKNSDMDRAKQQQQQAARRDKSYDSFKTWSGKLEKHLLGSRPQQEEPEPEEPEAEAAATNHQHHHHHMPRVQRFFAALEGPELDKLRSSEELMLPSDKTWPFLLRFPVSAFGMVLGMSSQAILWKRIAISASTRFLHITVKINLVLWCVSVALMCVVSALYAAKLVFYFEAVRREYYHPIRANFFFAPWIACLFLAIGVPEAVAETLPHWLWYLLMAPILCLELKIYGQWISGGQRRLSRVANPSNHLSIVGNFVGALLGGIMGLKEGPLFFFAVGLAHYMVLFVTLYQRLPTSETLPRDLHPVFFLFVATPSVACLAWARITGVFDYGSRIAYFIAMFLYASLVSSTRN
ncbi:hypothetical protein EJB05_51533 [Eragrostis curvula]|uniref:S-type anion channel SLAH3 n=1 Tax=Eragrostis curvula TaxID=38414 RepID=A0A5J9SVA0_9POAL|nr:hypothetical protein EJB05_51533 [Eragrostis curvula]